MPGIDSNSAFSSSILRRSFSIKRRQAAADAEIDPRPPVGGVVVPQVIALAVGHHFERQLVMVAQEHRPLAVLRDLRRLAHDVGDRVTVLGRHRHVDARHQREVERHVAFVAGAEILQHVLRPLVGLGQQHAVVVAAVELVAQPAQDLVRFRQVLVVGALALDQVGHGVEPHAVDPEVEPVPHDVGDRAEHPRVVEIEVGLVRVEAVPVDRPAPPGPRSSSTSRCRER